jgi:virginiamycin B lyase
MTTDTADEKIFYQGEVRSLSEVNAIRGFSTLGDDVPLLEIEAIQIPPISPDLVGMALGPDDSLWWCEAGYGRIGRRTKDGEITHFPIQTKPNGIQQLALGPDGAFWFTNFNGNAIGRITMEGEITQYETPAPVVDARDTLAAVGGDPAKVWFNSYNMPIPSNSPMCIVRGPDDAMWYTELMGNRIGRIDMAGNFTRFDVPTPNAGPTVLAVGTDGELWITYWFRPMIARMTLDGTFTEWDLSEFGIRLVAGIMPAPDGELWFTNPLTAEKGTINRAGELTWSEIPGAKGLLPTAFVRRPDGELWLRINGGFARLNDDGTTTPYSLGPGSFPFGQVFDSTGTLWIGDKARGRLLRVQLP